MHEQGQPADSLSSWLWSLLCWDGVLPVVTAVVPFVVARLPIEQDAASDAVNKLIIAAWFIRILVTLSTADTYPGRFRVVRWGVIGLAVSFLAVVELLILHPIALGVDVTTRSLLIAAVAYVIYFTLMAAATYRRPEDPLAVGERLRDIGDRIRLEDEWIQEEGEFSRLSDK